MGGDSSHVGQFLQVPNLNIDGESTVTVENRWVREEVEGRGRAINLRGGGGGGL